MYAEDLCLVHPPALWAVHSPCGNHRTRVGISSVLKALGLFIWVGIISGTSVEAKARADTDLFANGSIPHLAIEITPEGIESLRKDHRAPVRALIREDGSVYRDVAIHIKGAAGSLREIDDRPSLTLVFNKFVAKQKFHGLRKVHLNNSVQDPAYLDEQICGELCRSVGVPAARAAHASLTLNGRTLGVYVLKEAFNKDFLAQYFEGTDGNLYDGGFCSDIGGETEKIGGSGKDDRADLKSLVAAAEEPNAEKRWERLDAILDVDRFVSMMVLETILVHWDGYSFKANNYKVYANPDNGKLVFFTHGMDQMFGRGGEAETSIFPSMEGIVAKAVMSTAKGQQRYGKRLHQVFSEVFKVGGLTNRIRELAAPVRVELAATPELLKAYDSEVSELNQRIVARYACVYSQLVKHPGFAPEFKNGIANLDGWLPIIQDNSSVVDVTKRQPLLLHIGSSSTNQAGWRSRLILKSGRYLLKGLARIEAKQDAKELREPLTFGIRLDGTERPQPAEDLTEWQSFGVMINVNSAKSVDLLLHATSSKREVWFDASSLRLVESN